MYTSAALLALAGFLAAAPSAESPSWLTDYSAARAMGRREHKPLAVFLGTGKAGWNAVCRNGELDRRTKRLLTDHYVCVYVDTSKPAGRALAADFELGDGAGIVLSDRTGQLQAFRHTGELSVERLDDYLSRFADPDLVVRTTVQNDSTRVSSYPPEAFVAPVYAPVYAPAYDAGYVPASGGSFGGFSGGGRSC
jgi:hypothetical protein